jgi:hypothetical protein
MTSVATEVRGFPSYHGFRTSMEGTTSTSAYSSTAQQCRLKLVCRGQCNHVGPRGDPHHQGHQCSEGWCPKNSVGECCSEHLRSRKYGRRARHGGWRGAAVRTGRWLADAWGTRSPGAALRPVQLR